MTSQVKKALIVYCSPSGTTRHIAQVIEKTLEILKNDVQLFDLGKKEDKISAISEIQKTDQDAYLFIGSPVYVSHPVPPVMDFISKIPDHIPIMGIPFVTWGGASSGIALYEIGKALMEKGIHIIAAAKILAQHSLMWRCKNPLGAGHPDHKDDNMIQEMVSNIHKRQAEGALKSLELSELAYYPENVHAEMEKMTLGMLKPHMPKREVDENLCTQCEQCLDFCPTDAISFSPYPEFDDNCIFCFNCVRDCPEDAIKADLTEIEARIQERSKLFSEQPLSNIWSAKLTVKL